MAISVNSFTAFTEESLINGSTGRSLNGIGEHFFVPEANVRIAVSDDDAELGGDSRDRAKDADGQTGSLEINGVTTDLGSSQFFIENFFRLVDEDGNVFWLAEIEYEDMEDDSYGDFFTFVGNAPPPGTKLTVESFGNTMDDGARAAAYSELGAGPLPGDPVPASSAEPFPESDPTVLRVSENEAIAYDFDTTGTFYTEDVWFAAQPDCIMLGPVIDEIQRDRDGNFAGDGFTGIGLDLQDIAISVHDLPDYLKIDTFLGIDTTQVEEQLTALGAGHFRLAASDKSDGALSGDDLLFEFFAGSASDSGFLTDESQVPMDYIFTLRYRDIYGNVDTVDVCIGSQTIISNSPIAFDLNGSGAVETTGASTVKGHAYEGGTTVAFDIDNDGTVEEIEWIDGSGDGLLYDTAQVGPGNAIDGGALFGDEGGTFANGYVKLALRDANGNNAIEGAELNGLAIWVDDGDGVLEAGETQTLAENGISEISTMMIADATGRMVSDTTYDAEAAGSVAYSLTGSDAEFFRIDAGTGELNWRDDVVPDYERPADTDGNNLYDLTINRTGSFDGSAREHLQIIVQDEPETSLRTREDRLMESTDDLFQKALDYHLTSLHPGVEFTSPTYNAAGDLVGTNGAGAIYETRGDGFVVGLGGNDVIAGQDGDDDLFGGDGDDQIFGDEGQDLLDGGAGTDVLVGGQGIDVFVFREGDGTADIQDFELGVDILDIEGFADLTYEALTLAGNQVGDDVFYVFGTDELILRDVQLATMIESDLCIK